MKRLAIVAALLLAAAAIGGIARPDGPATATAADPPQRTITVSGTGSESSTPTRATLSFGVQTQAATAEAALASNGTAMKKVIAALQDAGAKDVRTQTVSLSPVFGDDQKLQGYQAVNTVSATVTYAAAGATIDDAVEAGANQVYGPTPLASDSDALYDKALAEAVADAREHAKALAAAAGATLGAVVSVAESGSAPMPFAEKAAADAGATPVVPGSQETTATVTVIFELG